MARSTVRSGVKTLDVILWQLLCVNKQGLSLRSARRRRLRAGRWLRRSALEFYEIGSAKSSWKYAVPNQQPETPGHTVLPTTPDLWNRGGSRLGAGAEAPNFDKTSKFLIHDLRWHQRWHNVTVLCTDTRQRWRQSQTSKIALEPFLLSSASKVGESKRIRTTPLVQLFIRAVLKR